MRRSPNMGSSEAGSRSLSFTTETLPLQADADGAVRVGKTRVTLDTVVAAFSDGATAEEIVQRYPFDSAADTALGMLIQQGN